MVRTTLAAADTKKGAVVKANAPKAPAQAVAEKTSTGSPNKPAAKLAAPPMAANKGSARSAVKPSSTAKPSPTKDLTTPQAAPAGAPKRPSSATAKVPTGKATGKAKPAKGAPATKTTAGDGTGAGADAKTAAGAKPKTTSTDAKAAAGAKPKTTSTDAKAAAGAKPKTTSIDAKAAAAAKPKTTAGAKTAASAKIETAAGAKPAAGGKSVPSAKTTANPKARLANAKSSNAAAPKGAKTAPPRKAAGGARGQVVTRPGGGLGHKAAAPVKRVTEGYEKDERFLASQRAALERERATYLEQAASLKAEAESLVEEMEPGDIQFDDESGEGGTVTVDRERDLALSAQALAAVEEIDHALAKMNNGTYGICENCGRLIPKARLEALPYARLCIDCKSGGLSRR